MHFEEQGATLAEGGFVVALGSRGGPHAVNVIHIQQQVEAVLHHDARSQQRLILQPPPHRRRLRTFCLPILVAQDTGASVVPLGTLLSLHDHREPTMSTSRPLKSGH